LELGAIKGTVWMINKDLETANIHILV